MKCEFCGGTLSLENEYCPHCGRPNEHARKHIEDMRHYDSVYEETKGMCMLQLKIMQRYPSELLLLL